MSDHQMPITIDDVADIALVMKSMTKRREQIA